MNTGEPLQQSESAQLPTGPPPRPTETSRMPGRAPGSPDYRGRLRVTAAPRYGPSEARAWVEPAQPSGPIRGSSILRPALAADLLAWLGALVVASRPA